MFGNRLAVAASPFPSPPSFSDSDEISTLLNQIIQRSSNQCTDFLASQNPNSVLQTLPDVPLGEVDECNRPSEEGLEALVEEASKRRGSSKRRRAAEVHNMSEKRRRSRINERMKALQDLIPNSNKTDKASMLDEVIEYLKQLQLQVQMLTLRNGLMLNPMCVPKQTPLSMLSMSNGSPVTHSLESSSLAEFLKLHQSSNISLNSKQINPQ